MNIQSRPADPCTAGTEIASVTGRGNAIETISEAINLKAGQTAPDFTVPTLGEGTVSLHDYQGEVVMVMFWSSWCSRCKDQLEFLKKMPFLVGVDDGLKVWDLYKIAALPTSMIVGPDGKLLFIEPSFNYESPETIDNALQSAFATPIPR